MVPPGRVRAAGGGVVDDVERADTLEESVLLEDPFIEFDVERIFSSSRAYAERFYPIQLAH